MNALDITALTKTYPGRMPVLCGVDLAVPRGSITALLGLNGSGKTTTLRILMGLTSPDSGSIHLDGAEIDPRLSGHRHSFGAVLDEPMYFDWLSPRDYLVLNGRLRGIDRRTSASRTAELLEFFDLSRVQHELIRTFSTGMKKKVSLAAAVMHMPRVLLLDEPFEGIDPVAARDIRETLKFLATRGTAILVTSHILDTVERLSTEIAVLHHGRIALHCRAEALRTLASDARTTSGGDLETVFLELVSPELPKTPPSFFA